MPELTTLRIALLTCAAGLGLLQAQNLHFLARQDYAIVNAGGLAIGDFNGDGIPDVVTGESSPTSATCLYLGNGDGTFRSGPCTPTAPRLGPVPEVYAAADFNGDGKLDLVFSNSNSTQVYVVLGNGDGTFQAPITASVLGDGAGLAVADFNGDGKPDLAVAIGTYQALPTGVAILLGNGDGTFGPPTIYSVGSGISAISITTADFNNDKKADLAAGTIAGVTVLLGNGDGTFVVGQNIPFTTPVPGLTSGDYNRDGKEDLAATLYTGEAAVMLGNGDGTFGSPVFYNCNSCFSLATGDINGDGIPDLATAGGVNSASILFGKGDGTFRSPVTYAVGNGPVGIGLSDLRRNGRLDVVTVNTVGDSLSVLLNQGKGRFQDGIQIAVGVPGYGALAAAFGDFNGDGKGDVVVATSEGVQILLGTGKPLAPYTTGAFYSLVDCWDVVTGDFNRDGIPDLAVASYYGIVVLLGVGDGTFQVGGTFPSGPAPGNNAGNLAVTDVNRDGKLDLVTGGGIVLMGNGDGTFQPYYPVLNPYTGAWVAVADFNGDGNPDLAFGYHAGLENGVAVLLGNGDGTFQAPQTYTQGADPLNFLVTADLNGDGKLDLASSSQQGVFLLFGNGDGTFQGGGGIAEPTLFPTSIAVGDYNGDGKMDLAVSNAFDFGVAILAGNGRGLFTYQRELGTHPPATVVGTHNLLTCNGDGTVSVLINLRKNVAPADGN